MAKTCPHCGQFISLERAQRLQAERSEKMKEVFRKKRDRGEPMGMPAGLPKGKR